MDGNETEVNEQYERKVHEGLERSYVRRCFFRCFLLRYPEDPFLDVVSPFGLPPRSAGSRSEWGSAGQRPRGGVGPSGELPVLRDVAKLDNLQGGGLAEIIGRDVARPGRDVANGTRASQRRDGGGGAGPKAAPGPDAPGLRGARPNGARDGRLWEAPLRGAMSPLGKVLRPAACTGRWTRRPGRGEGVHGVLPGVRGRSVTCSSWQRPALRRA